MNDKSLLPITVQQAYSVYATTLHTEHGDHSHAHAITESGELTHQSTDVTHEVSHTIGHLHHSWHAINTMSASLGFAKIFFAAINLVIVPILAVVETIKRRQRYAITGNPIDLKIPSQHKKNYVQNALLSLGVLGLTVAAFALPVVAPALAIAAGALGIVGGTVGIIRHEYKVSKAKQFFKDKPKDYIQSLDNTIKLEETALQQAKTLLDKQIKADPSASSQETLRQANTLNQLCVRYREHHHQLKQAQNHHESLSYAKLNRARLAALLGLGALALAGIALVLFPPLAIASVIGVTIAAVATVATIGLAASTQKLKEWWQKKIEAKQSTAPAPKPAAKPQHDLQSTAKAELQLANDNKQAIKNAKPTQQQLLIERYTDTLQMYSDQVRIHSHYANDRLVDALTTVNQLMANKKLPQTFMQNAIKSILHLQTSINTAWLKVQEAHPVVTQQRKRNALDHIKNFLPHTPDIIEEDGDKGEGVPAVIEEAATLT